MITRQYLEVAAVKRSASTFETDFATNRLNNNQHDESTPELASRNKFSLTRWPRVYTPRNSSERTTPTTLFRISYDYDELVVGNSTASVNTTAVMLVHPIGVGIGKWYHDRLLKSIADDLADDQKRRMVFLSPDLLGSYTASSPVISDSGEELKIFPLLNVTDWTEQLEHLMSEYETKSCVSNWAIVANGGCAPIALNVARLAADKSASFKKELTNVVISSPPRLSFFLEGTDPKRVLRSYHTLSGVVGTAFWRYALRKDGKFIQNFSERNLVGDPASLGNQWTPNCINAARHLGGKSRYSTFAFLAGALQDGCRDSLDSLKGTGIRIDFIRGTFREPRPRPKSFFWTRKRKSSGVKKEAKQDDTIEKYVERNGNQGRVRFLESARVSLAWEDPRGYARELLTLLCS